MRDDGCESLQNDISLFCEENKIFIPSIDDMFVTRRRPRRNAQTMTNYYHYRVELFYTVIDMQFQKLNNCFNEMNMELLLCAASLNPCDFLQFLIRKC